MMTAFGSLFGSPDACQVIPLEVSPSIVICVIAVFIASSVAVCTPMAIPANAMILGPGNVRFKDFMVPGLAVSAVCFVVSMILLPIFYPFYPG